MNTTGTQSGAGKIALVTGAAGTMGGVVARGRRHARPAEAWCFSLPLPAIPVNFWAASALRGEWLRNAAHGPLGKQVRRGLEEIFWWGCSGAEALQLLQLRRAV